MWQPTFLCQGRDFETDFKDKKGVSLLKPDFHGEDLISSEHSINQLCRVESLGSLISSTWRLRGYGLAGLWACLSQVSPRFSQGFIHSLESSSLQPP